MTSLWRRVVVLSVFVSMLCFAGHGLIGKADGEKLDEEMCGDVKVWVVRTGSDNAGFDLLAKYEGEGEKTCTNVKVTVTMGDDSKQTFPKSGTYSGTVIGGRQRSLGGEAGLTPKPIKAAEIDCGGSCK